MDAIRLNKNKTTKFILPLAFEHGKTYKDVLTNDFINAYIADLDEPDNDNRVTILLKDNVKEVLDIKDTWETDYYKIIAGEYSETSDEYKKHVLDFWQQSEESLLWAIIYKSPNDAIRKFWEYRLAENSDISDLSELYPGFRAKDEILMNNEGDE